jgi:hypothetical protein
VNWAVNADFVKPFISSNFAGDPASRSKEEAINAVKRATCLLIVSR